jgi:hypothetical protein
MRFAWRWIKRAIILLVILVIGLLAPVGYNELACRGDVKDEAFTPQIETAEHRDESATYLTYPEWHIVFAYDDYAKVLEDGNPHKYGYFRSISGFWSALCNLTETADNHGGAPETKNMVYVIGVSFTAELLAKATYEETIGRLFSWFASEPTASDKASAQIARDYAEFLHQIPWYKYNFPADIAELKSIGPRSLRDRERQFALGLEFGTKTQYAKAIAKAVEAAGQAKLTLRTIVLDMSVEDLCAIDGVTIIRATPDGTEIETPRYASFTTILRQIAAKGGRIAEIAGNDEIMLTITGRNRPEILRDLPVLASLERQGYDDLRWLVNVQLSDLSTVIRALEGTDATLEHIFDY